MTTEHSASTNELTSGYPIRNYNRKRTEPMSLPDLRTFHDPDLHLPIGDIVYTVKSPNPQDGVRLRRLFGGELQTDEAGELDVMMRLLGAIKADDDTYSGGVYQEMVNGGVTWDEIQHAGLTALLRYGQSVSIAETYWATGGSLLKPEKAPDKKPAAKKDAPRKSNGKKA